MNSNGKADVQLKRMINLEKVEVQLPRALARGRSALQSARHDE